jgi:hypothetical protein
MMKAKLAALRRGGPGSPRTARGSYRGAASVAGSTAFSVDEEGDILGRAGYYGGADYAGQAAPVDLPDIPPRAPAGRQRRGAAPRRGPAPRREPAPGREAGRARRIPRVERRFRYRPEPPPEIRKVRFQGKRRSVARRELPPAVFAFGGTMGTATQQRLVLSQGQIIFTQVYADFQNKGLTASDRRIILGFCKTHFKYGGRIGKLNYNTAQVIGKVVAALPGRIKVYR